MTFILISVNFLDARVVKFTFAPVVQRVIFILTGLEFLVDCPSPFT